MQSLRVQYAALTVVVALAAALRLYDLGDHPAGFYCDEAGLGYNAYTIANAGTDENGNRYPLFFWSFGVSYKNPAYIYAAAIPVKLFGTTEFAVRVTSAMFGIGTVIGLFFLGRTLMGPWLGLFSAFFLAIVPWHLHFSRIAFELISFPFFFVLGLNFFIRFTQGKRTLPAAMFFFGLCFYAYAIANLFVPLFVLIATLLFLPMFFRRWGQTAIALVVLIATVAPIASFYLERFGSTGSQYFRNTTHLQEGETLAVQAERTWSYYQRFFSPEFLFERGDPIVRHAVPGFGELYPAFLPLLLLGLAVALFWPNRATKLLLVWLLLYPLGASLMTEIPSATRAIIGVPVFCLLAGLGVVAVLRALGWIGRWRPLALTLQTAAVCAGLYVLVPQVQAYLHAYFVSYPAQSAPGYGGFQYGYRDAIHYMESRRDEYDLLMLTAVEVNQPQVFPQFYRGVAPGRPNGYLILNPAEYGRYSMNQRILGAVRPTDLDLFSDYEIHREIVAPGGRTEFVVAELRARKNFLTNWLILGLFDNEDGNGIDVDHIDITKLHRDGYKGAFDTVYWRRITPQFVLVDLNQYFTRADPRHLGNPEHVCAYAAMTVQTDTALEAFLEISGTDDVARVWLNGRSLTPFPLRLGTGHQRRPIDLQAGDNLLVVKSCENVGGWAFKARLTDADGADLSEVRTFPEIPDQLPQVADVAVGTVQVVEGFSEILSFAQRHESHPDYRGEVESWWVFVRDEQGEVAWRTAPVPEALPSVFAFTASTSHERGRAELFVNGKYALTFDLGPEDGVRRWQRGPYVLTFVSKKPIAGNSGFLLLQVPAEDIVPGKSVELRVLPAGGFQEAWFGLKGYRDTVAHEGLDAKRVAEAMQALWDDGDKRTVEQPEKSQRATPPPTLVAPAHQAEPGDKAESNDDAAPEAAVELEPTAPPAAISDSNAAVERPRPAIEQRVQPQPGLHLPLSDLSALEDLGAIVAGVDATGDEGAWFPSGAKLEIPNAGAAVGEQGTLAFWVEPGWDGSEDGDRSFVQLRDPQRWENRIQVFKNGRYLRFLFTDATGGESGVGTDIDDWVAGERHYVTATWADGLTYLYVDGLLVGTNPYEGQLKMPESTPLLIGSDHPGGARGAEAVIGDFQIKDRETTVDELQHRIRP